MQDHLLIRALLEAVDFPLEKKEEGRLSLLAIHEVHQLQLLSVVAKRGDVISRYILKLLQVAGKEIKSSLI